jgi:hypothetical protein
MKETSLIYISRKHKWPLTFGIITDYVILFIAPISIAALSLIILFLENDGSIKYPIIMDALSFAGLVVSFLLARFLKRRMDSSISFVAIPKPVGGMTAVIEGIMLLNWNVAKTSDTLVVAYTRINMGSWGETITVVMDEDWLLFNSRPARQPITLHNSEQENLDKFLKSLKAPETLTDEDFNELKWTHSDWRVVVLILILLLGLYFIGKDLKYQNF